MYKVVNTQTNKETMFTSKKAAIKFYRKFVDGVPGSMLNEMFYLQPWRDQVIQKKIRHKRFKVTRSLKSLRIINEASEKQQDLLAYEVLPNWVRQAPKKSFAEGLTEAAGSATITLETTENTNETVSEHSKD